MSASHDTIRTRIVPVVEAAGFDLDDLSVTTAGRRRLIRIVVDSDNGVQLDDAAALSREVSASLDEDDVMGTGAYVLEVTSRGVDRPLTLPRHWRRNSGRLVDVQRTDAAALIGRILACTDSSVDLDVEGAEAPVTLNYAEIERAIVQVEMNRSADPDEGDLDAHDDDQHA